MPLQLQTLKALQTLDIDRNRNLTAQELKTVDSNNDGRISAEEGKKVGFDSKDLLFINKRMQEGLIPKGNAVMFSYNEMRAHSIASEINAHFNEMDQDKNGLISSAESAKAIGNPAYKGTTAAAVTTLYKLMSDFQGYSDDTQVLPKLPQHAWLDKFPLQNYDERGLSRKDLDAFAETARNKPGDARVSEAFGRFSMSTYPASNMKRELFPKGIESIRPDHIEQGEIGDCYFLAAVASLANTPSGKKQILNMIKENANGTFTVSFPGKKPVTIISPTDMELSLYSNCGQDGMWLSVLEKGYAQLTNQSSLIPLLERSNPYDKIGNGALLMAGVGAVSGKSTDTDVLLITSLETLRNKLKMAVAKQRVVTAGINKSLNPWNEGRTDNGLPMAHAYSVLDYNAKTDEITIRNPWGSTEVTNASGGTRDGVNDGTFKMPLTEFKATYSMITYQAN
jgi:Ca2+-binding EF-hand superfamily protein